MARYVAAHVVGSDEALRRLGFIPLAEKTCRLAVRPDDDQPVIARLLAHLTHRE